MATYTVAAGDTAIQIAQKLGLSSYTQLGGLGSDPSLIHPGQVLTYGASSPSQATSTSSTPSTSSAPSSGGYSSDVPSGDPLLSQDMASLNSDQSDLQTLAAQQAAALNTQSATNQGTIANAYQTAEGQTGLQGIQNTYNSLQDAYTKAQGQANAAPVNAVLDSAGHDVMSSTAAAAGTANALVPGLTASNDALALVPAQNALNTAMQNTQNIAGNIVTGAQLNQAGFTAGQQIQLQALESKITQGQQLTNDEYNSYTSLKSAQIGAAAQVQSANIGAGATEAAATTTANASEQNTQATNALNKIIAELENPGASVNGNGVGSVNLQEALTGQSSNGTPSSIAAINSALSKYGF
jgi:hypothetical protein